MQRNDVGFCQRIGKGNMASADTGHALALGEQHAHAEGRGQARRRYQRAAADNRQRGAMRRSRIGWSK